MIIRDPLERLRAYTLPPNEAGCTLWSGPTTKKGYGITSVKDQKVYAHRLAYSLLVGPIPDGLQIDHVCHNQDPSCLGGDTCLHRRCVNPLHLEPVTMQENLDRSGNRGANFSRRTHCMAGHEYTRENTAWNGTRRRCRTCKRLYNAASKARRRAQISKP